MNTTHNFRIAAGRITRMAFVGAILIAFDAAHATTLVYTPVNPTFGGDPANGAVLMNAATAQNKHVNSSVSDSSSSTSTLDQFNSELQQAILSRVATSVTSSIVGPDGSLKPGTINTGNFSIAITQVTGGNLQVTTTDKTTGSSTTFIVSGQ